MPVDFEWIVPTFEVVSLDNASVKISIVVHLREPNMSMKVVADYLNANEQLLQTLLRSISSMYCRDKVLANKEMLISHMHQALEVGTRVWGLEVSKVDVQHINSTESTTNVSRQNEKPKAQIILSETERERLQAGARRRETA